MPKEVKHDAWLNPEPGIAPGAVEFRGDQPPKTHTAGEVPDADSAGSPVDMAKAAPDRYPGWPDKHPGTRYVLGNVPD